MESCTREMRITSKENERIVSVRQQKSDGKCGNKRIQDTRGYIIWSAYITAGAAVATVAAGELGI